MSVSLVMGRSVSSVTVWERGLCRHVMGRGHVARVHWCCYCSPRVTFGRSHTTVPHETTQSSASLRMNNYPL